MKKLTVAALLGSALLANGAIAHQAGDVLLRAGGVFVSANSSSTTKTDAAEIRLDVTDNAQLGLTATYMLSDNIGVELLGATPFSHKVSADIPALGLNLGEVVKLKQLPPSLYAQYYFLDKDAGSRPYIGAGFNYTRFFSAKSIHAGVQDVSVKKHSFGPVVNAGIDIKLSENAFLNAAVWYTHITTKASFTAPTLTADYRHEVKVKLDPIVFFLGAGYRF